MNSNLVEEANHKGYENPIIKGAQSEVSRLSGDNLGDNIMMAQLDVNRITSEARKVKKSKDKIKILNRGKKVLEKEANGLSEGIKKDVAELLNAKG